MEAYLIQFTRYLVMQSWQIAVLTIAVALAAFALKSRSAHIRYFLWLIVLAKCLVPPFYTVPLGVLPREKLNEPLSVTPSPKALTMVSETLDPGMPQSRTVALKKVDLPRTDVKPAEAPKVSATPSAAAPARFNVIQWLGIAWMVGAGAYLAVNLLKVLRTNYWLWRKRSILPTKPQKDIENILYAYGLKRFPKIWLMDSFSQPFVWGLLRGSIYLPTNFQNIKKPEHQKSILGHELSHVVRFDAAVNFLQILAQAIFWFHPLVWWANKKIRTEREKCCDEMVIARLGAKAKDYSMAIVETLAARSESTHPVPSLAIVGPAKNIEERIISMLKPGKKFYKRPSLTAAVTLLLFALLTAATGFVLTASEEKTQLGSLEQKIVAAAKKAKRSVVRISWSNDPAKIGKSYSGVILTAEGYVATCVPYPERHDLSPGKAVSIHLADGRRVPGIVIGSSQEWHFDLMKITQTGSWPHAEIGSSVKLKPGEICLALGYPQPTRVGKLPYDQEPSLRVGRTTTTGLARWLGTSCRIDTSGDNGGGLFDLQGRLIGIHDLYDVKEQMAMHWTIEIIQQHWKEMTGLKPPTEELVSGQVQDMGQSSDKTESLPVPSPDDPHLATALAKARQATVAIEESGVSGVLVTPDGYVVTCAHHRVLRGTVVTIHLADGRAVQGKMLGRHPLLDIGLAKVTEPGPWLHTQMGSAAALKPGDLCLALGYPASDPDGLRRPRWQQAVVRVGRIRDTSSVTEELRTSCGSMGGGGYSGGGLFDSQGRLIGVHQGPGRHSSIDLIKKFWDLLVKDSSIEDPVPFDRSPTAEAFRKAVQNVPPITVEVLGDRRRRALGTIVSSDGYVLTKASELRGSISCRLADGRILSAAVAKLAPQHDLALLKIDARDLPQIRWSQQDQVPAGSFVGALRHGEPAVVGAVTIPTRAIARAPGWLVLGEVKDAKDGVEVVELKGIWRSHTPLRKGDVIIRVEGHPTPNVKTFKELTRKSEVGVPLVFAGDPIRVGVRRDGKDMELRFPLLSPTHDAFGTTSLRNSGFPAVFDTDAIIRKDSCGGPVVDRSGEVVGITIAMPTEQRVYVVPAAIARNVAEGKEAAGIPGVSIASAAGPPSLDEIKTRLMQQRSKIESLYTQTKTEFKSLFSAEELQEIHVGGSDLGLTREHFSAFKGPKRYYRYVESYGDIPSLPPAPDLPDDATEAEKAAHKWKVDQRKRFEEEASWLPRTVGTRMDHARGFNGKMLWERTVSDQMHPDGRVERGVPSIDSHIVNRTPWVPSGEYLYWLGWVLLGQDLATVSTSQADECYIGSLPGLLERWPYSVSKATEVVDGAKCVVLTGVIERTVGTGHVVKRNDKLWLDLDHGLALRKRKWRSEASRTAFRLTTSNWQEVAPGFWLPKEIEVQTVVPSEATGYAEKYRGRVVLSRHVTLVQCIVNQVEDNLFEVPIKPGDQVEDLGAKATIEGGYTSTKSLHKATADGNIGKVKSLISQGADISAEDEKGRTPLHFAAKHGHKDVAEILIAKGADVNVKAEDGWTPLQMAAITGPRDVIELLIVNGADVNATNKDGYPALHGAAVNGHKDVVELLIAKGADVNAKGRCGVRPEEQKHDGFTPLHFVAECGHKNVVEFLLAKGAVVNAKDEYGRTPLFRACNRDTAKLLVSKGADVNARDENGQTPLHSAAKRGRGEVAELLLAKGANINAKDRKGRTPLHFAAEHGHKDVAESLIAKGTDVNAKDKLGHTALHLAALDGRAKVAKILVDHSADVNAKNRRKMTALHYATKYEFWEIVKLLVAAGADADVKDDTGTTPVYEAMTSAKPGGKEVVEILVAAGARLPTIHIAAYRGDLEKVRSCLEEGTGVNAKDEHGGTPLHAVANSGEKEVIKLLISKGADLQAKDGFGNTPLHFAAMHGYEDAAKLLLASGVNVNAKDQHDYTPLHWAATRGHKKLSELLIAKGADVKAKSNNFEMPLHCAAWNNHKEVVKLLISRGADVNVKEKYDWTPLHWAANEGHRAIAELLIANGADLNAKKYDGGMPLHSAASEGRKSTVELLIAKGANVNARDKEGQTPLTAAKEEGHTEIVELLRKHGAKAASSDKGDNAEPTTLLHEAAAEDRIEQIKLLISSGVDVNGRNKRGETPLFTAAARGNINIAELLVSSGADVNAKDKIGHTALHLAARFGRGNVAEILIAKGANVNAKRVDGLTPLHFAVTAGHMDVFGATDQRDLVEVVEVLIAKGAGVNTKDNVGRTPLHYAARYKRSDIAKLLIARGADVNAKSKDGETLLDAAAMASSKDLARLLIANGAKVYTLLHSAAYIGDLVKVKSFIKMGIDINAKNAWGSSPLHSAATGGHRDVVELLIANGANVNAKNIKGWTPLHIAAERGNDNVAELFLAKGVDVDIRSEDGRTPLHVAAEHGHKNVAELLVAEGANVNAKNKDGVTPLHFAAYEGDKDMAELLISRGADIDAKNKWAATPLHWSALGGRKDMPLLVVDGSDANVMTRWGLMPLRSMTRRGRRDETEIVMARGPDVIAKDARGDKPMDVTAETGHKGVARLLIAEGAELDAEDHIGQTPLHIAARYCNKNVAELLLAKGADVNAKNKSGPSPLHIVAEHGFKNMVELLLSEGADVNAEREDGITPLHKVANSAIAEVLIAKGARVKAKDKVGRTPLHYAVWHKRSDIIELLIARGADVNAKSKDGQTPLDFAASASSKDLVELLIANGAQAYTLCSAAYIGDLAKVKSLIREGADVNPENALSGMPLYYAATGGHRDVVELLIASGANVNTKNIKGWTPLHGAAWWNGGESVVGLLIANGADVNAKTNDGRTPLLLATKKWHTEIAEVLRKHGAKDGSSGRGDNAEPTKSLSQAAADGDIDPGRLHISRVADVNAKDETSRTPLHLVGKQKEQKKPAEKTLPGRIYAVARGVGLDAGSSADQLDGIIAMNPQTGAWEVIMPSMAVKERVNVVRLHPDGQAFVYSITKEDDIRTAELWLGNVRGRNRWPLATGKGVWPVWSPDGERIIASTVKDKKMHNVEAWRLNADGSNATRIPLPATELVWDWSADGEWFVTLSGSDDQIYVMHPDGTERRRLTNSGFNRNPRFAPDSRRIVYARQQRGTFSFSLRMVNVDGNSNRELFRQEGVVLWSHCWSPDGRHLAVAMCDLQELPGGGMALIAGEEEAGWQKLPGGGMGLIAGDAEAQDWRISIIDINSQDLHELRLGDVRTFHIGSLDWR